MSKKVIEPVVIKQEAEDNIRIEKKHREVYVAQLAIGAWDENEIRIDNSNLTTVAKAIDPEYQKVEDENIELQRMLKLAREVIEDLQNKLVRQKDQNAKFVEALKHIEAEVDNQNPTHETIWRIAYQALQQSKNIE